MEFSKLVFVTVSYTGWDALKQLILEVISFSPRKNYKSAFNGIIIEPEFNRDF